MRVEQRSARTAGIDRRVDLNDGLDFPIAVNLQRAIQTRNDARGQRTFQSERIAESEDPHADFQLPRITKFDGKVTSVTYFIDKLVKYKIFYEIKEGGDRHPLNGQSAVTLEPLNQFFIVTIHI